MNSNKGIKKSLLHHFETACSSFQMSSNTEIKIINFALEILKSHQILLISTEISYVDKLPDGQKTIRVGSSGHHPGKLRKNNNNENSVLLTGIENKL